MFDKRRVYTTFEKTKINDKESGVGPFKKTIDIDWTFELEMVEWLKH